MQLGFDALLSACNRQRHLLIAVECLQLQLEDQRNEVMTADQALREELMACIVDISASIAADVESFTQALLLSQNCPQSTQQFREIEGACHQLLDTNLFVAETALVVISKCGHAHWTTRILNNTATRTRSVQAQLREHLDSAAPHPS